MSELARAVHWSNTGPRVYEHTLEEQWYQGRGVFGGQITGALTHAFVDTLNKPQFVPRSMTTHFCTPGQAGPATCRVSLDHVGRSGAQISGRVIAGAAGAPEGKVIATAVAFFGPSRSSEVAWSTELRPDVEGPDQLPRAPWLPPQPTFCQHIDYRYLFDTAPFCGAAEPVMGGWARPAEGGVLDWATFAAMLDVWAPPALAIMRGFAPAASLDMTTHFLAAPPSDAGAYLLHHTHAPTIGHGYAETAGTVWSQQGQLLARTRQMVGVWEPPRPRRVTRRGGPGASYPGQCPTP